MARPLNRLLLLALERGMLLMNEYAVVKVQAKGEHSKECLSPIVLKPQGFQQFVAHSQALFPLLRHCVIQILRENRVRRQRNHAAGCRISTVVLCLFHVFFHISPQRGRNIDQPQSNTYLFQLSPSTQQTDGAKVAENCPPATGHSPKPLSFKFPNLPRPLNHRRFPHRNRNL